jgi:TPR repeat protein
VATISDRKVEHTPNRDRRRVNSFASFLESLRRLLACSFLTPSVWLVALCFAATSVHAQSFENGIEAFLKGDYAGAYEIWGGIGAKDARASLNLALMYANGVGITRDLNKAAELLQRASDLGSPVARYLIGRDKLNEDDVAGPPVEAMGHLYIAAVHDYPPAQFLLAAQFSKRGESGRDDEQAAYWLQRAARNGHGTAIGQLRADEPARDGAENWEPLAVKLSAYSAPTKAVPPKEDLGVDEAQRAFVEQRYLDAAKLWEPLANQGQADAQYGLGYLHELGLGVSRHMETALAWYRLAAEQGHPSAQGRLGRMYLEGQGTTRDQGLAIYWLQNAADNGDPQAQETLRVMRIE